jgi:hypothetical protein
VTHRFRYGAFGGSRLLTSGKIIPAAPPGASASSRAPGGPTLGRPVT